MTNRLQHLLGPPREAPLFTDLYEVKTFEGMFVVSFATARAILRALDHAATPDWLAFRDVYGVDRRVLALCVYRIRYVDERIPRVARSDRAFSVA